MITLTAFSHNCGEKMKEKDIKKYADIKKKKGVSSRLKLWTDKQG